MNRLAFAFGMGTSTGLFIAQHHGDKVEFLTTAVNKRLFPTEVSHESPLSSAEALLAFSAVKANSNKFAVLSTLNSQPEKGAISSRTIQPFEIEYENDSPVIFFNTSKLTRKFEDLNLSDQVTLTYLNQQEMSCVCYIGTCERVPYPQSTRHWRDWLYMFYPEGPDESTGSRFTTWKVVPRRITVLSFSDGVSSNRNDGRPPELEYNKMSQAWELVCNGREDTEE